MGPADHMQVAVEQPGDHRLSLRIAPGMNKKNNIRRFILAAYKRHNVAEKPAIQKMDKSMRMMHVLVFLLPEPG